MRYPEHPRTAGGRLRRRATVRRRFGTAGVVAAALTCAPAAPLSAQLPFEGEVRQLVTFRFLPGRSADALRVYTEEALPLYRAGTEMRSFRGLREVESPVPLDLVVVSSFDGMGGMDRSNRELRTLADATARSAP